MDDIQPNSPEALAKARKLRNIFMLIAAGNIVFVAIVMWMKPGGTRQPEKPATPKLEEPAARD